MICPVRCRDTADGQRRLRENLLRYQLGDAGFDHRVSAMPANLDRPSLGLPPEAWGRLEEQVDVIFHNGAAVNHLFPYAALKATNVTATEVVLRLAFRRKLKPVHFVSTIAVFPALAAGAVTEDRYPEDLDRLVNGYAQSKAVAERRVRQAGERGLPVTIYRPGLIGGSSRTGAWTTRDWLPRVLRACIGLRMCPDTDDELYLTPVDYVSAALVHLALQPRPTGETFHLVPPTPIRSSQLFEAARSAGFPMATVGYSAWRSELLTWARRRGTRSW